MLGKLRGYRQVLPALAICRIGRSDPELLERLKQEFAAIDLAKTNFSTEAYRHALFVTLLKLGETDFVSSHYADAKLPDRELTRRAAARQYRARPQLHGQAPEGWAGGPALAPRLKYQSRQRVWDAG